MSIFDPWTMKQPQQPPPSTPSLKRGSSSSNLLNATDFEVFNRSLQHSAAVITSSTSSIIRRNPSIPDLLPTRNNSAPIASPLSRTSSGISLFSSMSIDSLASIPSQSPVNNSNTLPFPPTPILVPINSSPSFSSGVSSSPPQKQPRRRGRRANDSAKTPRRGRPPKNALSATTTTAPSTGTVTTTSSIFTNAQTIDEVEHKSLYLEASNNVESNVHRTEHTVIQHDPLTGLPSTSTIQVVHDETKNQRETLQLQWTSDRALRKTMLTQIRSKSVTEAQNTSKSFHWYELQVRTLISQLEMFIFKSHLKDHLEDVFGNEQIIMHFLCGMPAGLESHGLHAPKQDMMPWLACLWTMPEMLEYCGKTSFVNKYFEHPLIKSSNTSLHPPASLFFISDDMMSAYVTGHMLLHCMPNLRRLMRPHVLLEHEKLYFPSYLTFNMHDDSVPPALAYEYDFANVLPFVQMEGLPRICARGCKTANVCELLGVSCEGRIDAGLLVLLRQTDESVFERCMPEIERAVCTIQPREYTAPNTHIEHFLGVCEDAGR